MFDGGDELAYFGDVSKWDTSQVTDMAGTFQAAKFSGDVSKWDTSKVTNMMYTFRDNGPEFQDITTMVTKNIFNSQLTWDTSQVTTMNGMFWEKTPSTTTSSGTRAG